MRRDATEVALDEPYPVDPIVGQSVIHTAHATRVRRLRKLGSSLELARVRMMGVIDADATVVGREPELAIVRSFCADRNQPGVLLLEGDAGIGKTVLWEAGLAIASAAGHTVLRCRPAAAEAQLSFAALADLLVDVLDAALPALAVPQRRALEVALLLDDAKGPPPDVRALAGAFLGALRHASSSAPVLVAIDDAQWLDEPSRTVLEFAVRRLGVEPVGVLASRRGTGGEPPLGLGQALAPERVQQLALAPLSMGALHRLVQTRLGMALSRPVLRRLHAESGGNPFYALEIGRALQRRGSTPRSDEPLPVPPTLQQLVQERVTALPDRVRRLLEVVAALYDRRIDRVHELAHEERLDGAIDQAIAAGVLTVADDSVQFSHPLLAAGVYAGMGPERRRDVHRRLAGRDTRNEASTVHLALAAGSPDADVAGDLDASATRARARGAAASAGRYAEQAARLTPPDDVHGWARRTITAADNYIIAGDPARARELLIELIERTGPSQVRAEALSLLAWNAPDGADLGAAARLGEQALAEAAGDLQLEATTRLRLGVIEEIRGNLDASMTHRRIAAELAKRAGDPGLRAGALSALGYAETMRGARVVEASRRAVEIERSLPGFLGQYSPSISLGQVLMYTDALDEARSVLAGALEQATAAGHEDARCTCLFHLADLERRAGNWEPARAFSDETRELNAQAGNEQEYASCLVVGALLDAAMGRVDEGRAAARTGLAAAEQMGDATFAIHHRGILGFIELSLGNAEAAQRWLEPASDVLISRGIGELSIYPAIQNEVDAAVETGMSERAEHLVSHLERLAAVTGRSWTRAMALRGRGLILAADGDVVAASAHLQEALLAHEAIPQPFELARTLLIIGKLERRAKRKRTSREALDRAAAIFDALPAPLWKAKADDELARLGRRSPPGGLTETEAVIAELAATGMTNPEIAAAVFVSRKTVEANLSKVYRKLGVRSRVELARRLPTAGP